MVKIICGAKGKGKTKKMLDLANQSVLQSEGNIVYLDKSGKNMFELNNQIRLININDYPISSADAFIGFVSGMLAGNHDIEKVFLDSFLNIAFCNMQGCETVITALEKISQEVEFVISISADEEEFSEELKEYIFHSC